MNCQHGTPVGDWCGHCWRLGHCDAGTKLAAVGASIGSPIAKQLRDNAGAVLVQTGSGIPAASIAGALQMAADEIERLQKLLDATKPTQADLQKQVTT